MWEYLNFHGTVGRLSFLFRTLAVMIGLGTVMAIVMIATEGVSSTESQASALILLAISVFFGAWVIMATEIRRWRDMGLSPWFFLWRAIAGYAIVAVAGPNVGGVFNLVVFIMLCVTATGAFSKVADLTAENS